MTTIQVGQYILSFVNGRTGFYFTFKPFTDFGYPSFYLSIGAISIEANSIHLEDFD